MEPARRLHLILLGSIVALGAVLRFATLDARSYWVDETATAQWVQLGFGDMLSIVEGDSTPPVYYVLAWLWAQPFGTGEVGLRSLSALLGTATIPVVYAIAAHLISRRAGLVAALLTALSPILVWHSQDARHYALVIFLAGLSFLSFVRALDAPRPAVLAGWAAASALLLASVYTGVLLVVPEACWLFLRHPRRGVALAIASVGAVGLALLALQRDAVEAVWIERISLLSRIAQVPAQFIVGYQPPFQVATAVAGGVLALVAIGLLLRRGEPDERRAVLVPAVIGGIALVAPIAIAIGGYDRLLTRVVTAAWIPVAVVLVAGLAARRSGRVGAVTIAAIASLFLWIDVTTATDPKFEREDWRRVSSAVGAPATRAIVMSSANAAYPMGYYRPESREMPKAGARVDEIVIIGTPHRNRTIGEKPVPPRPSVVSPPAPGFTAVERIDDEVFTLVRFRSRTRVLVGPELAEHALGGPGEVLVEQR